MFPDEEDFLEDEDQLGDDLFADDDDDDDDDDADADDHADADADADDDDDADALFADDLFADTDDEEAEDDDQPKEEVSAELYQQAQAAKAMRLFIEDRGRRPYSSSELHFFVMSSDVERPIEPEDCDIETARKEAEKG